MALAHNTMITVPMAVFPRNKVRGGDRTVAAMHKVPRVSGSLRAAKMLRM